MVNRRQLFADASWILLAGYFFLCAVYTKKFVYWSVHVGGFPIFVTDAVLASVLILRFDVWKATCERTPRPFFWLFGAFFGYGVARLGFSAAAGSFREFGALDSLKQSALFYQSLWIFVALLLTRAEQRRLLSAALLGIGVAQLLGWVGFFLMGRYTATSSRLIGYPVGNETILPLYLFALPLWGSVLSFFYMLSFGLLWLTQFVLYMKRNWVFSVLAFALPVVLGTSGPGRKKSLLVIPGSLLAGLLLAWVTLKAVEGREKPYFYHASEKELAAQQRRDLSPVAREALAFLDGIYQYTDPVETNISMSRVIFKGDLAPNGSGGLGSMMAFRMHLWKQAWAKFKEKPMFGQGFGPHYAETQLNGLPAMVDGKWISGPHNSFLAVLNRMGVLGFALFSALTLWVLWHWWLRGSREALDWMLVASLVSTSFFALFNVCLENPQGGVWYWFFLGAILSSTGKTPSARQAP